jgi:TolB protein
MLTQAIELWSRAPSARTAVGPALVVAFAVACQDGVSPLGALRSPIVFANIITETGWDIYEVDFLGNRRRALAPGASNDLMPSFSPDHRQIAFMSDRSPAGLWVMGAGGEAPRSLYATEQAAGSKPAWSPDKRWIIVELSDAMTRVEVATGEVISLGGGREPEWSPDGEVVAFNLFEGIALMTPDGADKRVIIPGAFDPGWSPDGRLIAYRRLSEDGTTSSIYVAAPDGTGERRLTARVSAPRLSSYDEAPAWSPDGAWLTFHRAEYEGCASGGGVCGSRWDILVVSRTGGGLRRITHTEGASLWPTW